MSDQDCHRVCKKSFLFLHMSPLWVQTGEEKGSIASLAWAAALEPMPAYPPTLSPVFPFIKLVFSSYITTTCSCKNKRAHVPIINFMSYKTGPVLEPGS